MHGVATKHTIRGRPWSKTEIALSALESATHVHSLRSTLLLSLLFAGFVVLLGSFDGICHQLLESHKVCRRWSLRSHDRNAHT